jgi:Tol biopolymer transport system component
MIRDSIACLTCVFALAGFAQAAPKDGAAKRLSTSGRAATPGTRYDPQKAVFTDPVSGRTVWRMTMDGTKHNARNFIRDASGMEANSFSPNGTKICYIKSNHPAKPDGYYVMDIESGIETYVAPSGNHYGACEFSKTSDELFYFYVEVGETRASCWAELRAVDLGTYTVRTLKRFPEAKAAYGLTVNRDGSYIAVFVSVGQPKAPWQENEVHVAVLQPNGTEHPNWKYNPLDPPDMTGGGDFPYWSPVDSKVMRVHRDGKHEVWNIDTLEIMPRPQLLGELGFRAHACWTADGAVIFRTWGHADCHPLDVGLGDRTRVALDRQEASHPYIYVTQIRKANRFGVIPAGTSDVVAVHYGYENADSAHAHPHWSRDGKYLLFASSVTNTSAGTPPGGADRNPDSVDLFIVPMEVTPKK